MIAFNKKTKAHNIQKYMNISVLENKDFYSIIYSYVKLMIGGLKNIKRLVKRVLPLTPVYIPKLQSHYIHKLVKPFDFIPAYV